MTRKTILSLLLNGQNANIDNIQKCKGLHIWNAVFDRRYWNG